MVEERLRFIARLDNGQIDPVLGAVLFDLSQEIRDAIDALIDEVSCSSALV